MGRFAGEIEMIRAVCEAWGYGNVRETALQLWHEKDPRCGNYFETKRIEAEVWAKKNGMKIVPDGGSDSPPKVWGVFFENNYGDQHPECFFASYEGARKYATEELGGSWKEISPDHFFNDSEDLHMTIEEFGVSP